MLPARTHPSWFCWLGVAALAASATGCARTPRPPALRQGETAYENPVEKFRFDTPPGWAERERTEIDAGELEGGERSLIKYKRQKRGQLAFLRVTLANVPGTKSLVDVVRERCPAGWQQVSKVEELSIDRLPAMRVSFAGRWDDKDFMREVTAVRHIDRVFYFTGTYTKGDTAARDEIRKAVATARWERNEG